MQLSESVLNAHQKAFPRFFKTLEHSEPRWYLASRRASALRALSKRFPMAARESWKYTHDTDLLKPQILGNVAGVFPLSPNLDPLRESFDAHTIVFNNGMRSQRTKFAAYADRPYSEELEVSNLDDMDQKEFKRLFHLFERHDADGVYADLNEALHPGATCIRITRSLSRPLHLVYRSYNDVALYPRVLINVMPGVKAVIIEEHSACGYAVNYHTNAVCKVLLQENAQLDWLGLIDQHRQSAHVAQSHFRLEKGSKLRAHSIVTGGSVVRQDVRCDFAGEQSQADIFGLTLASNQQHIDQRVVLNHDKPNTTSHSNVKMLATDAAQGIFNGRIYIAKQAVGVEAHLHNRNLLLSERATINTKPELEIYTDDVQCSHGATVGRLDDAQLFYLRSRGLSELQAKKLLVAGFVEELLAMAPKAIYPWLSQRIEQQFSGMLKGGEL